MKTITLYIQSGTGLIRREIELNERIPKEDKEIISSIVLRGYYTVYLFPTDPVKVRAQAYCGSVELHSVMWHQLLKENKQEFENEQQ